MSARKEQGKMDQRRYAIEGLELTAEQDPKLNERRREFAKALRRVTNNDVALDLEAAFNGAWQRAAYAVAHEAARPTLR
jgi:hypothetical protein